MTYTISHVGTSPSSDLFGQFPVSCRHLSHQRVGSMEGPYGGRQIIAPSTACFHSFPISKESSDSPNIGACYDLYLQGNFLVYHYIIVKGY